MRKKIRQDRGGKFFIPTPMASAGRSSDVIGMQDRCLVHLSHERSTSRLYALQTSWTSERIANELRIKFDSISSAREFGRVSLR